jgi:uncharacterized protein (TIGR00251 family)
LIDDIIKKKDAGTIIDIIVTTGSKKEEISGVDEWRKRLVVRIKERPVEGKANAAIIKFFSEVFNVPLKSVRVVSGQKTSQKTIEVEKNVEEVKALIKPLLGED